MSEYVSRRNQAIEACDKVINGIEDETLSVSSSLLTCMKISYAEEHVSNFFIAEFCRDTV